MANIKSAKKRILVSKKRYDRNKSVKSAIKTQVKKVNAAIEAGDKTVANTELQSAIKQISSAASKGIFHKNTAARKVSSLTKAVNKMA